MSDGLQHPFASPWGVLRARTWADVDGTGRVRWDPKLRWHLDFRTVRWPGAEQPRRVRVTSAPGYGRFETEHEAAKALIQIQSKLLDGKALHDVLAQYLEVEAPEDAALHRWRHDFLRELERRHARGQLSEKRLHELQRYEGRGHLEFWREVSLHAVSGPLLERWVQWLEETYPHLSARTIKHLVDDFGTFLRYEHRMGALERLPQLPRIKVPVGQPKVPAEPDLARILEAIPSRIRGLWLARSRAGLRASEARRLDVTDYAPGSGELTIPGAKSKTRRGRVLPLRDVVPELDRWILEHRSAARPWEPLFVNETAANPEMRWKDRSERRVWAHALETCGFEHIRPNEAGRHAFGTHETSRGTDRYALKDWMGHASISSTERYITVSAVSLARRMRPRSGHPTDTDTKSPRKP